MHSFGQTLRQALAFLFSISIVVFASNGRAQEIASFSLTLTVQNNGSILLVADLKGGADTFFQAGAPGRKCENYSLFESTPSKEPLQPPTVVKLDVFDSVFRDEHNNPVACKVRPGDIGNRIEFQLNPNTQIHDGATYSLVYRDPDIPSSHVAGSLPFSYTMSSGNPLEARTEIKIQPSACLGNLDSIQPSNIIVKESSKIVSNGKLVDDPKARTFAVRKVDAKNPDGLIIHLRNALPGGVSEHLEITISGIVPGPNYCGKNSVTVKGIITTPSLPKTDSDAKELVTLGGTTAVHSAPVYTSTGKLALLHPPDYDVNKPPLSPLGGYFDPSATWDVGVNSSNSANSIVLAAPITWETSSLSNHKQSQTNEESNEIASATAEEKKESPNALRHTGIAQQLERADKRGKSNVPGRTISSICGDTPLERLKPSTYTFSAGPVAEIDQTLKRKTLLAELQFGLHPCIMDWTIASRNAFNNAQFPSAKGLLKSAQFGFQLVPALVLDEGGTLADQTVSDSKTKTSVLVPQHAISRVIVGVKGSFEFPIPVPFLSRPMGASLGIDESGMELVLTESIGYVDTAKGALIRRVSGLQPHSKPSFNLYFDPEHHYALNLVYEDGRSAPNFVYLNKFQYGIKVTY
jgi:hypothetical protein